MNFQKALAAKNHITSLWIFSLIATITVLLPLNFTFSNSENQGSMVLVIIAYIAFFFVRDTILRLKYREHRTLYMMFYSGMFIDDYIDTRYNNDWNKIEISDMGTIVDEIELIMGFDRSEVIQGMTDYLYRCMK